MSCGNVPDGQGTAEEESVLMPRRRNVHRVDKGTCQRCRTAKSMFVIRSVTYCSPCFESTVQARFTRQLLPPLQTNPAKLKPSQRSLYRPPRQRRDLLIALSSGAGSMAMLDLLCSGGYVGKGDGAVADKTKGEKEVVWDKGVVVYVEFCGVVPGKDRMEMMRGLAEERGLGFAGLRAEDVFVPGLTGRLGGHGEPEHGSEGISVDLRRPNLPFLPTSSSSRTTPLTSLQTLLSSLPPASRPALLSSILSYLLNLTAQSLPNTSHLLLGETSTRQAQRVISGTALGRGWALPLELASSITLPSVANGRNVVRMKPMKEVSMKEAAILCHLKGLETMNWRGWGGERDGRKGGASSIEMLTEGFIARLNVSHSATVSTITRTGAKLVFAGSPSATELCPMCHMPVDPSALAWKSRTALTSLLKTPSSNGDEPRPRRSTLAPLLCYACLTTLTPALPRCISGDPVMLPPFIAEGVSQRREMVDREDMRAEIGQYILDDGNVAS